MRPAAAPTRCRVCLAVLRPDGRCVYRCDPALSAKALRRAEKERRAAAIREARRQA